jgi:hypothetical protein
MTVLVPSGARVSIRELFAPRSHGLNALAKAVKASVVANDKCIRQSLRDRVIGRDSARGFAPTARNYRYYALAVNGLIVGFPVGHVGAYQCGRIETTVPYRVLRLYLSKLGRQLVAGVRRPRFD